MPRKDLIQVRAGTTAQWDAADAASVTDPTRLLAANEEGFDTTTKIRKIGDGVTKFADLPGYLDEDGLSASIAQIVAWAKNPDTIITGAITRNGNGVVTSAVVQWPDGTPGVFTTDTIGTLNTIDAYHVTYVGVDGTKTFTQPTVTRNGDGAATNVPAIVVS